MLRTGRRDVDVQSVKIRLDEKKKEERSKSTHRLGTVIALELLGIGPYQAFYDSVNDFVRAGSAAQALLGAEELPKGNAEIDRAARVLQGYEQIVGEANRLLELEQQFEKNEFYLFCFLSGNKEERLRAAKLAIDRRHDSRAPIFPSDWLRQLDDSIVEKFSADYIEFI